MKKGNRREEREGEKARETDRQNDRLSGATEGTEAPLLLLRSECLEPFLFTEEAKV